MYRLPDAVQAKVEEQYARVSALFIHSFVSELLSKCVGACKMRRRPKGWEEQCAQISGIHIDLEGEWLAGCRAASHTSVHACHPKTAFNPCLPD